MHIHNTLSNVAFCWSLAVLGLLAQPAWAAESSAGAASSSAAKDPDAAEAHTFLILARHAAQQYQTQHGRYPAQWQQMDLNGDRGPRLNDPASAAQGKDGTLWHPKNTRYSYQIVTATDKELVIRAINAQGQAEYEIRQGEGWPVKYVPNLASK